MTDPERISKQSQGLAAQLLRAGAEERPADSSVQQTLAVLGVSAAVVSTTGTASALSGTAKATGMLGTGSGTAALGGAAAGGTVKVVSTALLVKWIGVGVVGGIGLAGAASVVSSPVGKVTSTPVVVGSRPAPVVRMPAPVAPAQTEASSNETAVVEVAPSPPAPAHVVASEPAGSPSQAELGALLAAEVAYVDRARALLAAGQTEEGLTVLGRYERDFPEARLLPEVLFLRLETCERVGRRSEAQAAARRLLDAFPKSPHASRARKLLSL